ncbi:putative disease resistance protein isoform X3 [Iris pallida]|uniref:Disease resistance protein isoform X3 n=1 Tax=Iris pallida TaxID=29817 RepID=A0AAX6IGI4_IRIPA|nr:putative disease resistance protein isoform X3 [Iris pallida]
MEEAVVSVVADTLSIYLLQEPSLLYGVREEVCWLERELRQVLCSIPDAVTKKANNELVAIWIRDIRDVAYDIEDFVESFMLEADNLTPTGGFQLTLTRSNPSACSERSMLMIDRCFPIFGAIVSHYRAGRAIIQNLETRIIEISNRKEALGLNGLDESREIRSSSKCESLQRSRSRSHLSHSPIGLEKDEGKILELLRDGKNLRVIPIIGVTGQGKTTFAEYIYHNEEVEEMFDVRYWISIPRNFKVPELLVEIIRGVGGKVRMGKLVVRVLKKKLRETLSSQGRYLIVMDDFIHKEAWDIIQTGFPDAGNGSRVIFTTQHVEFARSPDPIIVHHELSFLNSSKSMELFLKRVYPTQNVEALPDDLTLVGQSLVEKCEGLPISVVLLGSLLSTIEKTHHKWLEVLCSLNKEPKANGSYSCIFPVCFAALPCHLKACFLYVCSFSEESEIPARRLMRLWIAEGLVPPNRGTAKTELAEAFLEELAERSMVEVAVRRGDGSIKAIRVRNIFHHFCKVEARSCRFLHFVSSGAAQSKPISPMIKWARRLALHVFEPESYIDGSTKKWRTPKLRTLILGSSTDNLSLNGLKFLRVVDVEVANSGVMLPQEIETLIHLRYLRWRAFVDFQRIKNLRRLQILHVEFGIDNVDNSIGNFRDLRFLKTIKAGSWIESGLVKLTNLEKLELDDIKDEHWKALLGSLGKLHRLRSLTLSACYGGTIPKQAISIFSCQHSLRRLKLFGRLSDRRLPDASAFPPNITKLGLLFSQLSTDPMPTLKELPNLTCVELHEGSYAGRRMHCQAGGFPQLRYLKVHCLHNLRDWKLEKESMPSLTQLRISNCNNLKTLEGLENVPTLSIEELIIMPKDLEIRILDQLVINENKGAAISEVSEEDLHDVLNKREEELARLIEKVNAMKELPSSSQAVAAEEDLVDFVKETEEELERLFQMVNATKELPSSSQA